MSLHLSDDVPLLPLDTNVKSDSDGSDDSAEEGLLSHDKKKKAEGSGVKDSTAEDKVKASEDAAHALFRQLLQAVTDGDAGRARELLAGSDEAARSSALARHRDGTMLLHLSCELGHVELADQLLEASADPFAKDAIQQTALGATLVSCTGQKSMLNRGNTQLLGKDSPVMILAALPDTESADRCTLKTFQSMVLSLTATCFTLADFALDVLCCERFAHSADHRIALIGYASSVLLGVQVANNARLIFTIRRAHPTFFQEASGQFPIRLSLMSALALTNLDSLMQSLKLSQSQLPECCQDLLFDVAMDIKTASIQSQLLEDVPQSLIQLVVMVLEAMRGRQIPLTSRISLSLGAAMIVWKITANVIYTAFDYQVSHRLLHWYLAQSNLGPRIECHDVFVVAFEILVLAMDLVFTFFLLSFQSLQAFRASVYGIAAIGILAATAVLGYAALMSYMQRPSLKTRLAHVLLEPELAAAVLLLANVHPMFLLVLGHGPALQAYLKCSETAPLAPYCAVALRNLGMAALAAWGVWKDDDQFPVPEVHCIGLATANVAALCLKLFDWASYAGDSRQGHYSWLPEAAAGKAFDVERFQGVLGVLVDHACRPSRPFRLKKRFCLELAARANQAYHAADAQRAHFEVTHTCDLGLLQACNRLRVLCLEQLVSAYQQEFRAMEVLTVEMLVDFSGFLRDAEARGLLPKSHWVFRAIPRLELVRDTIQRVERAMEDADPEMLATSDADNALLTQVLGEKSTNSLLEAFGATKTVLEAIGKAQTSIVQGSEMSKCIAAMRDRAIGRILERYEVMCRSTLLVEAACTVRNIPKILKALEEARKEPEECWTLAIRSDHYLKEVEKTRNERRKQQIFAKTIELLEERLAPAMTFDVGSAVQAFLDFRVSLEWLETHPADDPRVIALRKALPGHLFKVIRYHVYGRPEHHKALISLAKKELAAMDPKGCERVMDYADIHTLTVLNGGSLAGKVLEDWMPPGTVRDNFIGKLQDVSVKLRQANTAAQVGRLERFFSVGKDRFSKFTAEKWKSYSAVVSEAPFHPRFSKGVNGSCYPEVASFLKACRPAHSCQVDVLHKALSSGFLKSRSNLDAETSGTKLQSVEAKLSEEHLQDFDPFLTSEPGTPEAMRQQLLLLELAKIVITSRVLGCSTKGMEVQRALVRKKLQDSSCMGVEAIDHVEERAEDIGGAWDAASMTKGVNFWLDDLLGLKHQVFSVLGPNVDYGPVTLVLKEEALYQRVATLYVNSAVTMATGTGLELRPWCVSAEWVNPWSKVLVSESSGVEDRYSKLTMLAAKMGDTSAVMSEQTVKRKFVESHALTLAGDKGSSTWSYIAREVAGQAKLALSGTPLDVGYLKNKLLRQECRETAKQGVLQQELIPSKDMWIKSRRMGRKARLSEDFELLRKGTIIEVISEHRIKKDHWYCRQTDKGESAKRSGKRYIIIPKASTEMTETDAAFDSRAQQEYDKFAAKRKSCASRLREDLDEFVDDTLKFLAEQRISTERGRISAYTESMKIDDIKPENVIDWYLNVDSHGRVEAHLGSLVPMSLVETIILNLEKISATDIAKIKDVVSNKLGDSVKVLLASNAAESHEIQSSLIRGRRSSGAWIFNSLKKAS